MYLKAVKCHTISVDKRMKDKREVRKEEEKGKAVAGSSDEKEGKYEVLKSKYLK